MRPSRGDRIKRCTPSVCLSICTPIFSKQESHMTLKKSNGGGLISGLKDKGQGHWERKCENRSSCISSLKKWVDLRQTEITVIRGAFYRVG